MRIHRVFLLCLLIILPAANALAQTQPDFFGTAGEGVYRNAFFGMTLNFPNEWTVLSREEIEKSLQVGQDILKTQDKKNSAAIEAAAQREILILAVAEKNEATGNISNLFVGVRKQASGVTAEMVLTATKNLLLQNSSIKLVKDTQKIKLGGETFSSVELQNNLHGENFYQRLFVVMRKGYSLNFVVTYKKTESLRAMENVLQSLSFTK